MDFETLLHVAKKNQMKRPEPVKCLQTKFKPPTKEQRDRDKSLNEGVKRFLARKEEEERKRKQEAERRREELSAARAKDPKANKRIQHMLKRTKSANKSVMNDVDQSNTADTISGPVQPDDDDYGFVSEESSALYNKLMQKMYKAPSSDLKFAPSRKPSGGNILNTKERVKMALLKQEEDDRLPHKRKRRKREGGGEEEDDDGVSYGPPDRIGDAQSSRDSRDGKSEKPKPKRQAPPPMDFMELLRIAEQKQHEPVVIEPKVRKDTEPEQLMTKKQKEELRKAEELRRQKEARARGEVAPTSTLKRIPKIGESKVQADLKIKPPPSQKPEPLRSVPKSGTEGSTASKSKPIPRKGESETEKLKRERDQVLRELREKEEAFRMLEEKERLIRERDEALAKLKALEAKETKLKDCDSKTKPTSSSSKEVRRPDPPKNGLKDVPRTNSSSKEPLSSKDKKGSLPAPVAKDLRKPETFKSAAKPGLPSRDGQRLNGPREFPPKDVRTANSSRDFPPKDVRTANSSRDFPPKDVRTSNGSRDFPPRDVRPANGSRPVGKRPMTKEEYIKKKLNELKKRRIEDSDDEYDSEMDDFIDDGPDPGLDETEDVSDVIKQIFKYDKNRYSRYDDDGECMESGWGQVEKEEKHSARIGYLEDVADMLEEKKALARKKQKR